MILRFVLALLAAAMLQASVAAAETRVALVVGVSRYGSSDLQPLPNAANDARSIDAALRGYGFSSELVIDPTRVEFRQALNRLSVRRKEASADVVLLFFAGHGITSDNQGYLLASDSVIARDHLPGPADDVTVGRLLQTVSGARLAILLLDACRTTPELSTRLAFLSGSRITVGIPQRRVKNSVISYAAEPGAPAHDGAGANSPYTQALLAQIGAPATDIAEALKRVRQMVERLTSEPGQPPQRPSFEDERDAGNVFFFADRSSGSVAPLRRPASSTGTLATGEVLGILAGTDGRERAYRLRQLLNTPGITAPLSVDDALQIIGDIPSEGGSRSAIISQLVPILDIPLSTTAVERLLAGLGPAGRYTALLDLAGCFVQPLPEDATGRLLDGLDPADKPAMRRRLAASATRSCGRTANR